MNNLDHPTLLNENHLLAATINAAQEERKWTGVLLEHLMECDRRGLHLKLGYSSLHEFAVQYLGLSDGAAHRRIQSMRLTAQVPVVAEKISQGEITLSHASKLQSYFQCEERIGNGLTIEEKTEWVKKSQNLSVRNLEREILKEASLEVKTRLLEKTREISAEHTELRVAVTHDFVEKLEELKNFLGHTLADGKIQTLFEKLVDQELVRQRKKHGIGQDIRMEPSLNESRSPDLVRPKDAGEKKLEQRPHRTTQGRAHIPTPIKRAVWARAKGQCEALAVSIAEWSNGCDPEKIQEEGKTNGETQRYLRAPRRCMARRLLQVDLIHPVALGGTDELTNLRLLCAHHNRARQHPETPVAQHKRTELLRRS